MRSASFSESAASFSCTSRRPASPWSRPRSERRRATSASAAPTRASSARPSCARAEDCCSWNAAAESAAASSVSSASTSADGCKEPGVLASGVTCRTRATSRRSPRRQWAPSAAFRRPSTTGSPMGPTTWRRRSAGVRPLTRAWFTDTTSSPPCTWWERAAGPPLKTFSMTMPSPSSHCSSSTPTPHVSPSAGGWALARGENEVADAAPERGRGSRDESARAARSAAAFDSRAKNDIDIVCSTRPVSVSGSEARTGVEYLLTSEERSYPACSYPESCGVVFSFSGGASQAKGGSQEVSFVTTLA
mmetsp:Transcript_7496/g.18083  ORF Transcript_7496/g.18083 Transcript_7496/m.18083 type:complete len:304 (-) Transcript_7496:272-1183(-)